jgi:pseudaminic acid synthase
LFEIAGCRIGKEFKPYIIAELSANHGGSIDRAKVAINCAKIAGASAVKLQTYTPDTMTIKSQKPDFQIRSGLWKGYTLYDLYKEAYTPYEWHKELFSYAREIGITIFSTPFDETAVDLLEELGTPAYKVASFELTDLVLIELMAKQNKPILISTGMGSIEEIEEAVATVQNTGNNQILLFHCISGYPIPTNESNLSNIRFLAKKFGVEVGLSDHSTNNIAATVSIGLGAVAIEKHFKIDDQDSGPDSSFSLVPDQVKSLVNDCTDAWLALGSQEFGRSKIEDSNKAFRRSLYFVKDLSKGMILTKSDLRRIRPGYGLKPKFFNELIGKTLVKDVERGDPVKLDCFD